MTPTNEAVSEVTYDCKHCGMTHPADLRTENPCTVKNYLEASRTECKSLRAECERMKAAADKYDLIVKYDIANAEDGVDIYMGYGELAVAYSDTCERERSLRAECERLKKLDELAVFNMTKEREESARLRKALEEIAQHCIENSERCCGPRWPNMAVRDEFKTLAEQAQAALNPPKQETTK